MSVVTQFDGCSFVSHVGIWLYWSSCDL